MNFVGDMILKSICSRAKIPKIISHFEPIKDNQTISTYEQVMTESNMREWTETLKKGIEPEKSIL
jgi:hypothetical protein